jgi:hypothetical protein
MDYLPKVKLDYVPTEPVITAKIEEKPVEETKEPEPEPEPLIDEPVVPKDNIQPEEIFANLPKKEVKYNKNGTVKKPRPPMTEEHKAKMKAAREKTQKAKREARELIKEEKVLLRQKKVKEVSKLKKEIEEPEEITKEEEPIKEEPTKQTEPIDIEKAVLDGIMKYETIRKTRKADKKKEKEKEASDKQIRDTLLRATNPNPSGYKNSPYAFCY